MNTPKVEAAQRLAKSLQTADDWLMWVIGHPNEERALDRLLGDLARADDEGDSIPETE